MGRLADSGGRYRAGGERRAGRRLSLRRHGSRIRQRTEVGLALAASSSWLDYLDLYLIHWPMPERSAYVDAFKGFAHPRDQGRIRSIDVSNFEPGHPRILIDGTGIVPAVNQIELHRLPPQHELREVHAGLGIATHSWSPLGRVSLLQNATVTDIADAHGRTPAQVLIRWHVRLGNIVIPKSVNPERIASNFDVFDFELGEQDLTSIASLDNGTRLGPDPRTFNFTG